MSGVGRGDFLVTRLNEENTGRTEWEDHMIRLGNMDARKDPRAPTSDEYDEHASNVGATLRQLVRESEIVHAEREDALDELEFDDEEENKMLEEYRKMRLEQLKEQSKRERFGELVTISEPSYKKEVTEAGDVWVVVFLYKSGIPHCQLMEQRLRQLARKFKATKFVQIRSEEAIRGYPDKNLPTLLVYHKGNVARQFVGLQEFAGESTTADDVEWALGQLGAVQTEIETDPREKRAKLTLNYVNRGYQNQDSDSDDE
ncbi:phosducin-like protein [Planoprotostelium fungivorum]|uniref:Phosducin-like protein n=1 Tax=Planoprotostelium fungivorum TaxID=1890364 RepID=A0A2P6N065_9EUKA|nr:phosducin-like protein [Planoprotostelium fungivorum]